MVKEKNNEIDMTSGPLLRKMIAFAIPLIFSVAFQSLFNTADLVVVGKFGHAGALAAVGATTAATMLFINFFVGLSVGASVCVSRFYGAKDEDTLQRCVHTSIVLALVVGVTIGLAGVLFGRELLLLMGTPDDIIDQSALYMRIYFMGMPFSMMYNFCSSILRAVGDSKRCLLYIVGAGIINVILNFVFVVFFDMNVAGVAIATVISQGCSAFMALRYLFNYDGVLRVIPKKLRVYRKELFQILAIGVPSGLQSIMFSVSNAYVQAGVNSLGTAAISGSTAAGNIEGYVYITHTGITNTVLSFTGQNFGARNFERIKKVLLYGMFLCLVAGLSEAVLMCVFSREIIGFYTRVPEEIVYGQTKLFIICVPYFLFGIMECVSSAIRGMCRTAVTTATVFCACAVRILWFYTVFDHYRTDRALYISYPITWVATGIVLAVVFGFYFRKEKRVLAEETL